MELTKSKPLSLRAIDITDVFWKREMKLVRKEVIPYQWDAINDRIPGASPSYAMRNFKIAAEITAKRKELGDRYKEVIWPTDIFNPLPEDPTHLENRFYGFVFQDTDFSKWIEAVAYTLTTHPNPELEKIADEAIAIVCAAQQPNGYLDTYYIINDMSKIFRNLRDHHELYCLGHLTEGAVAYYEATGKDALLNAARKFADFVAEQFGTEDGKIHGYPGHEIAEMALVRLYEVTGEEKYLNLSKYFIDERGKRPYYFDKEHPEEAKKHGKDELWYQYHQAHLPVREQTEAFGHAVRAVYLYSGMADVARLTGDKELLTACQRLWDNITTKKMYVTGGIGSTHLGEAFTHNYDLPNDTAYSETCAAIGLIFFARRMLEIDVDSKYANVMERALYNTVLSGMALDGKSFFYVNPLEVRPDDCHKDERKFHVKPIRQKWFGCACCPPNIARTLSSLAAYAYTENEDTLFVHLYIGATIQKNFKDVATTWDIVSDIEGNGQISLTCKKICDSDSVNGTIALRIPDWCGGYDISCGDCETVENKGYIYISGRFCVGDKITLTLNRTIRFLEANSAVREDIGCVAVSYGPYIYCLEEIDNGSDLHLLSVIPDASCGSFTDMNIGNSTVKAIKLCGKRQRARSASLYCDYKAPEYDDVTLTFVPYYVWANRGENEMRVWVKATE